MDLTLKLYGKQVDEARQAFSYRWSQLEKRAKANEAEGVDSDAREKMTVIEEIMRAMEPQADLIDEIEHPPEAF